MLEEGEDDEGEWVCNVCPECEHNIEKKDDFVLRKVGICDVDIISKYKGSKLISSTAFLENAKVLELDHSNKKYRNSFIDWEMERCEIDEYYPPHSFSFFTFRDGVKNGPFVEFRQDNSKFCEGNFKDGKKGWFAHFFS